ncbi:hypothetical protein [Aurantibacillus circumpalustris]|uniref:hypothetical protein n=1 Tax=Aurantibacillus circumpalustris TaxID=3036359 RepID=UPI00295AF505|nr:hypothetical protein [Aurantibacillus circumpalustris]
MKHTAILTRFFILSTVFFCLILTSCKKEEIPGPKGAPGDPGGGGNATISNSAIFTIATTHWKANADSSAWVYSISSSLVTQDIVDKGVVKAYVLRDESWWELPFTQGDLFTQFGFVVGKVNLEFVDIHGGLPLRPVTSQYRIVVLSGS